MKAIHILKKLRLDNTSRDVLVGVVLAAIMGVNIVIAGFPLRLDLSRGKAYSLSPASSKIIHDLKEPVEIVFFLSDTLPTSFITTKNQVRDLLTEFKQGSSKITIKYVDPKKNSDGEKLAQEYGIQQMEFSQMEADQFALSAGYFSLGLKVNDNKTSIQQIDPSNLEYNLISLIYKFTQGANIQVGLVGMDSPTESMRGLTQVLGQQFNVQLTDLSSSIPEAVKTIVALDGQYNPLTEDSVENLSAFLQKGGKLLLFTGMFNPSDSMKATPFDSKVIKILDQFGITIQKDLVLSSQAEVVNFGADQYNRVVARYPFWLMTNVFNADASYTKNINYLAFPWVSSLALEKKTNITQKDIVRSTPQSWTLTGEIDLTPQSITSPNPSDLKQSLLIAYAKNTKTNGEIMIIPSTRFVQDNFLGRSGNLEFTINVVNELASNGALTGIRSRSINSLPLPTLSSNSKDWFKWGNVVGLPLLFSLYGFFRLRKRG